MQYLKMSGNTWLKARDGFYTDIFRLVLPIVIQNLITSAVSMADVVMLGRVNQTVLSAASLAGQVQFLLNIVYFGLNSALTILAAQYWGKGDRRSISRIMGIGLWISLVCAVLATTMAIVGPSTVMSFWTDDPLLRQTGAEYLRIVALSYLFAGFSQPYLSIMKSCKRVKLSAAVSALTLGLNVILNAILIFGLFGFPSMGIAGAALATVISRGVELIVCAADFMRQRLIPRSPRIIFVIPRLLRIDFVKYSLPAFLNDAMWGLAFNMNSVIMGHLGSDIVAANSIVIVVRDLLSVTGFGLSAAAAILLGTELGSGKTELAKKDASSIVRLTFLISLVQGVFILLISPLVPHFALLTDTAKKYLRIMLFINSVYQVGQTLNTIWIASIFRCGGNSKYGMILDISCMWFVAVPLGLISAFVLKLPPLTVYLLMCTDEFVKLPFALHHYRSRKWIANLTRDFD